MSTRRPVLLRTVQTLVSVSLVALGSLTALAPATASGRPIGKLSPRAGALFGSWVNITGARDQKARMQEIANFEASIGRKLDIDHHYFAWTEQMNQPIVKWDISKGRIPMISWVGHDTREIRSGHDDALLRAQAAYMRSLGKLVFLRWGWEMGGSWNSKWVHSASDYVAAWRHIHDVFVHQGATNAVWVWCPNHQAFDDGSAARYYPGDGYVDWICADGYNRGTLMSWSHWDTFPALFARFYAWASHRPKPLMVGETGCVERGGDKAKWMRDAGAAMKWRYPNIEAFVYWNAAGMLQGVRNDFRKTTSTAAATAYRSLGLDPYFHQPHGV